MSQLFNVGISALLANQRMLTTTSHNIANVNTEGYSRQRVELVQRPPQFVGVGFLGKGVDVSSISRSADRFVSASVRSNVSSEARASAFAGLADRVDTLLSDGTFTPALERFYNALQDVNNDPSSSSARLVLLNAAENLTARFNDNDAALSSLARDLNQQIGQSVNEINSLAAAVASINRDIVQAYGVAQGQPPNDLLDKRDSLLREMSRLVNISTVEQQDGAVNVFIGDGQLLVSGTNTATLTATPNALDGARTEVSVMAGGVSTVVSDGIANGQLAGLLEFRDQILDPTRNAMGRLAVGLTGSYNAQHRAGLDLTGALGGDLFDIGSPVVNAAAGNSGTVTVAIDPAALGGLTASDYVLTHDGTDFTLIRQSDGTQRTLSGAGPFAVDGLTFTVGAAPAAGDRYLIQPTKYLARNMNVEITDPARLAISSPVKSSALLSNIGSAKVSAPEVLDAANPALMTAVQIVFDNPPTTYRINGAGPLIPYTSDGNIDVNGWRVQVSGMPLAGDTFRVEAHTDGSGDNRNGLALSGLRSSALLANGTATIQDGYSQLVGQIGARTQAAQISRDALLVQRENAEAMRESVAGVNMDEEAANLIKFQQSYQGAAQIIQAANTTFMALIEAMRN